MPSSSRSGFLFVALAVALVAGAAGCTSPSAPPKSCQSSAECSADARCTGGTCVTNSPPVARVAVPASPVEANLVFSFDGSASADPDPGDSIVSNAWSFRSVSAPCDPPVVAGSGQVATVRFTCAGRYAVDLTVTDQMSAQGIVSKEFDVVPYSGPALLTIGPDVSIGHACTTGPAHCTPTGPVALSATPTPDAPADIVLGWAVEPPAGLVLDANRRVTFTPGADATAPTVLIETDGQAISGDWIFRVEARDAYGVVASGAIRVSIGNRPPVLTKNIPAPNHAFDGAAFTSTGEVTFTVTDPDGDDLVGRTVEWHHVGDGPSGSFTGNVVDGPSRVSFSIVVPFTTRSDAQYLIGGAGLERSIRFSISDVNGAVVTDVWPIVVGNRPPRLVGGQVSLSVDHKYDAGAVAYQAVAGLSTWSDPDGDPLWQVPGSSTGDPQCPQLDVIAGVSTVSCSLAYTGTPAVANFAGTHVVAQRVQDPWTEALSANTVSFTILNRAPTITQTVVPLQHSGCTSGACCRFVIDPESHQLVCDALFMSCDGGGSAVISGWWQDADGDPLTVTLTHDTTKVCMPSSCSMTVTLGAIVNECGATDERFNTTASDGAETVSDFFIIP
jgi:PKD domain